MRAVIFSVVRVLLIVAVLSLLVLRVLDHLPRAEHFIYLANAFTHGSLAVDNLPSQVQDKVIVNGHTYIPLGPMPAILLTPIAAVTGVNFDEYVASLALTLLNIWLLNRVMIHLAIMERTRRRWLLVLFFCGTIYLAALVNGNSWFMAHIVTTTFLLLALNESLGRRRSWLVGLWLGAAFLTRVTAIGGVAAVLYLLWRERRLSASALAQLAGGAAPALVFFLWYNLARFGSPFETGYGHAYVGSVELAQALSYGLFSPVHIPKNLYALLFAMPQPIPSLDAPVLQFPYILPSAWGMSIFITTPLFLYAFRARLRQAPVVAAWLATVCILVPLLLYYGIGWRQFGYRYSLDFYPFLFIPTMLALNDNWSRRVRLLIILCVLINLWGAVCSWTNSFV